MALFISSIVIVITIFTIKSIVGNIKKGIDTYEESLKELRKIQFYETCK